MPQEWVGLDVGGANLKLATADRLLIHRSFPLWRLPEQLADVLREYATQLAPQQKLAVTMTGELADCYSHKRAGVQAIVEAVEAAFAPRCIRYYQVGGGWMAAQGACRDWLLTAASNWDALARCVAQELATSEHQFAVLVDWGSTTCDLLPLFDQQVLAVGRTDPERMRAAELVYTGSRRSPIVSLLPQLQLEGQLIPLAQELFATMLDAYLWLGRLPEDGEACDTADGRPATREHAHQRLARLLCADADEIPTAWIDALAEQATRQQEELLVHALTWQFSRLVSLPEFAQQTPDRIVLVLSGAAETLLSDLWQRRGGEVWQAVEERRATYATTKSRVETQLLSQLWGSALSSVAPAVAVARLAAKASP